MDHSDNLFIRGWTVNQQWRKVVSKSEIPDSCIPFWRS